MTPGAVEVGAGSLPATLISQPCPFLSGPCAHRVGVDRQRPRRPRFAGVGRGEQRLLTREVLLDPCADGCPSALVGLVIVRGVNAGGPQVALVVDWKALGELAPAALKMCL
jgi:hypothetical protein